MIAGWPWWLWLVMLLVGSAIPTGVVVWMLATGGGDDAEPPPEDPDGRIRGVG